MRPIEELLTEGGTALVVDWPSPDVPETLAKAGWAVYVKGGPGPRDVSLRTADGNVDRVPDRVDLVYVHRPLGELPALFETARALGARLVWYQSGRTADGARDPRGCWLSSEESRKARAQAEAAGLTYVDDRYIVDALRELAVER